MKQTKQRVATASERAAEPISRKTANEGSDNDERKQATNKESNQQLDFVPEPTTTRSHPASESAVQPAPQNSHTARHEEAAQKRGSVGHEQPRETDTCADLTSEAPIPVPVRALVSGLTALNHTMLVKNVLLGSEIVAAHLDTCATHCFLSRKVSQQLSKRGYAALRSSVQYNVEQGAPLCVTSTVHVLPLTMINAQGQPTSWRSALFVVAECGADVIICYSILSLGEIVDYDPPEGYTDQLRASACALPSAEEMHHHARRILDSGSAYHYDGPEDEVDRPVTNRKTVRFFDNLVGVDSEDSEPEFGEVLKTQMKEQFQPKIGPKLTGPAALTEAEPYGKNPPLPQVVLVSRPEMRADPEPSREQ